MDLKENSANTAAKTAVSPLELNEAYQTSTGHRPSLKPKINHHSINPQSSSNEDGSSNNSDKSTILTLNAAVSPSISSSHLSLKYSKNSKNVETRRSSITTIPFAKSRLSTGFRYTKACLVQVSVPSQQSLANNSNQTNGQVTPVSELRTYLFETIVSNPRSPLWDQMQFWEDVFWMQSLKKETLLDLIKDRLK